MRSHRVRPPLPTSPPSAGPNLSGTLPGRGRGTAAAGSGERRDEVGVGAGRGLRERFSGRSLGRPVKQSTRPSGAMTWTKAGTPAPSGSWVSSKPASVSRVCLPRSSGDVARLFGPHGTRLQGGAAGDLPRRAGAQSRTGAPSLTGHTLRSRAISLEARALGNCQDTCLRSP